jgi:hypothetical protein
MSIQRFFKQIYRVIRFIPVIWKTFPWDHGSCLEIYKHSLLDLKHEIINGYGANGHKLGKKIDIMVALINRINNEWDYFEFRWNALDKEFGPSKRIFNKIPGDPLGCLTWDETNPKRESPEFIKRMKQYWKEEEYLKKQDLKMLSDMMYKWGPRLWD